MHNFSIHTILWVEITCRENFYLNLYYNDLIEWNYFLLLNNVVEVSKSEKYLSFSGIGTSLENWYRTFPQLKRGGRHSVRYFTGYALGPWPSVFTLLPFPSILNLTLVPLFCCCWRKALRDIFTPDSSGIFPAPAPAPGSPQAWYVPYFPNTARCSPCFITKPVLHRDSGTAWACFLSEAVQSKTIRSPSLPSTPFAAVCWCCLCKHRHRKHPFGPGTLTDIAQQQPQIPPTNTKVGEGSKAWVMKRSCCGTNVKR